LTVCKTTEHSFHHNIGDNNNNNNNNNANICIARLKQNSSVALLYYSVIYPSSIDSTGPSKHLTFIASYAE